MNRRDFRCRMTSSKSRDGVRYRWTVRANPSSIWYNYRRLLDKPAESKRSIGFNPISRLN